MKRIAEAKWQGDLKTGTGQISTASGTLASTPYSFHSRFEQGKGTNPEELLAAAHAGCFTMALSNQLAQAGFARCCVSRSLTDFAVPLLCSPSNAGTSGGGGGGGVPSIESRIQAPRRTGLVRYGYEDTARTADIPSNPPRRLPSGNSIR